MSHVSYKCADNNTALTNMLSPPTYVHGKCSKCASDVKRMYPYVCVYPLVGVPPQGDGPSGSEIQCNENTLVGGRSEKGYKVLYVHTEYRYPT